MYEDAEPITSTIKTNTVEFMARYEALLMSLILTPSFHALADESSDSCDSVLFLAGRNLTYKESQVAYADNAYEHLCSGTSTKIGLDEKTAEKDLVGVIATELTGGLSGSFAQASNLCKEYKSWRALQTRDVESQSIVVRASVEAWSECRATEDKGVIIHATPGVETIQFSIRRNRDPAELQAVQISNDSATCSVLKKDADGNEVEVPTGQKGAFPVALITGDETNILCKRVPQSDPNGSGQFFEAVEITPVTDRGSLHLPVPRDSKYTPTYASEVAARLGAISDMIGASNERLQRLGAAAPEDAQMLSELGVFSYKIVPTITACPAGYYVSGAKAESHTANYGAGRNEEFIDNMSLICSPIFGKTK